MNLETRFWRKVDKGAVDECWPWTASTTAAGYGQIWVEDRCLPAHRLAYELLVGPIAPGLVMDHLCRNPPCVNPAHLEPVTQRVNVLRGLSPCAANARKTHCHRGHALDQHNTYVKSDGRRECIACRPEYRVAA